jgi:protein-tyrosine phosphatase
MTLAPQRHLSWPHCLNLRDLGGMATPTGRTPFGVFVRGDDLGQLNQEGITALRAYGVSTILDLRRPQEVLADTAYPFAPPLYLHLPLLEDEDAALPFANLDQVYDFIVRFRSERLAEILTALAQSPNPVLFHCQAGKDRTGIIAALLLSLAGVSDQAILEDYALSDTYLASLYARLAAQAAPDQLSRVLADSACPPQRLAALLDYWQEQEGGLTGYLLQSGLSPTDLALLRARLAPTPS